jgi:hypothetical protein
MSTHPVQQSFQLPTHEENDRNAASISILELACQSSKPTQDFDSQQEWDEFEREMADQQYQDTYRNLINFLTLRDYPFKEGTVGMGWALTAHQLVVGDPSYLEYGRKKEFMSAVCGWD